MNGLSVLAKKVESGPKTTRSDEILNKKYKL